jgi:hypothetical protein
MAGFQVTKDALNQRIGSCVVAGESWFEDVERIQAWLAGKTDAEVIALGYTSEEVSLIKSSFVDLDNLRKVAYGQQAQANANNFFFWGGRLRGVL